MTRPQSACTSIITLGAMRLARHDKVTPKFMREGIVRRMNNRRIVTVLLSAMLLPGIACGTAGGPSLDDRVVWLKKHAVAVRSIDPADEDFADLVPIKDRLAGVRVVLLGEPSHGEGSALQAKARLAKFLHRQAEFDVLVWEAGLYEARQIDRRLRAGCAWNDAFASGLPDFWSSSVQVRPLLEYAAASYRGARPLEVSAFSIGWSTLCADLAEFFDRADPTLLTPGDRDELAALRDHMKKLGTRPRPKNPREPAELAVVLRILDMLKSEGRPGGRLTRAYPPEEIEFVQRATENLVFYARQMNRPLSTGGTDDNPQGEQEGSNLLYLCRQRYAQRKLVVWAHSCHLIRNCAGVEELGRKFRTNEIVPAGDHLYRALGREVYSVMFVAYGGSEGIWWEEPRSLRLPPGGSLEDLLHRTGLPAAFVDLRSLPSDHWLRQPLVARPLAFEPLRARWSETFDAVFFVDQATPNARTADGGEEDRSSPQS